MRPPMRSLLASVAALAVAVVTVGPATAPAEATSDGTRPIDDHDLSASAALDPIVEHVPGAGDRYDLAGGCFVLATAETPFRYVARTGDGGFAATAATPADAEPFRFQAFDLGKYLLFGSGDDFLAAEAGPVEQADQATADARERLPVREGTDVTRGFNDDAPSVEVPTAPRPDTTSGAVTAAGEPSALAEWIVRDAADGFTFHLPVDDHAEDDPGPSDVGGDAPTRGTLVAADDGTLQVVDGEVDPSAATFRAELRDSGCATWPEVELNVDGHAPIADNPVDETRGYLDAHLHMMAFEFIGGRTRCGRPWHPYGVAYALVDCPDHEPGGIGAALEFVLSGEPTHDTTGWPDFPYWPRYDSLTHEQVYYAWVERAWRGGLRMFTNLLVDNNTLCEAWVYKENSCNEMDGVRLQAQRLRELERYIDAQWGGPGEGWFRIVTDPFEARRTMNEGRLAVIMGIEVSVLFDCQLLYGQPQCDEEQIDRELAAVHDLGVRQMEFVNKFDNALSGVTGDAHGTGVVVNTGNQQDTGLFWQFETCPEDRHDHAHDKPQHNVVDDDPSGTTRQLVGRDAIFGAVLQVTGTSGVAPVYPEGPHCNVRGLTDLGRYLLDLMVERGMIFDPDHMSTRGREEALAHLDDEHGHDGVVSSHSWADETVYEKVLEMGGVVTPYAGSSWSFLEQWVQTRGWADDRYYFGIGYGADTNGFGSQGAPRSPTPEQAVTYPFDGFGGVTVDRQKSGTQTYDINTDGVDHYGLYPDWIEDIRIQADHRQGEEVERDGISYGTIPDGQTFLEEMQRGPEAYLQTWERAMGVANDACRDDRVELPTRADLMRIDRGTRYEQVLADLGQPHTRVQGVFTYCVQGGTGEVSFDDQGRVTGTRFRARELPDQARDRPRSDRAVDVGHDIRASHDHAPHDHASHDHGLLGGALPAAASGWTGSGAAVALGLAIGLFAVAVLRRRR